MVAVTGRGRIANSGVGLRMKTTDEPYARPDDVVFQMLSDESVLLNLKDSHYWGLDVVGTRMYQVLMQKGEVELALTQLLTEFDVDAAALRADFLELVAKLEKAGLIARP